MDKNHIAPFADKQAYDEILSVLNQYPDFIIWDTCFYVQAFRSKLLGWSKSEEFTVETLGILLELMASGENAHENVLEYIEAMHQDALQFPDPSMPSSEKVIGPAVYALAGELIGSLELLRAYEYKDFLLYIYHKLTPEGDIVLKRHDPETLTFLVDEDARAYAPLKTTTSLT